MERDRMRTTCFRCKRRIKVRAMEENLCACGQRILPFSRSKLGGMFASHYYPSIKLVRDIFLDGVDTAQKSELVSFILESAENESTRKLAILSAIEVLRLVEGAEYMELARRMVETYPKDHTIRYMYSNCLDLSSERIDHYEALKQRLVGTALHCMLMRKKNELSQGSYENILKQHLEKLEGERDFLDGKTSFPTLKAKLIKKNRTALDDELKGPIDALQGIADKARLRTPFIKDPRSTCVLDTNALSCRESSYHFGDPGVRFIIPPEVLIELANWRQVSSIPINLQYVEIREVRIGMPPEIYAMRCREKKKTPSIADRKVALLAIQERADAIVSADWDLLGTGIPELMEKQWGKRPSMVQPLMLGKWLERQGLGLGG